MTTHARVQKRARRYSTGGYYRSRQQKTGDETMQTLHINPIFKSFGRPRKEMTASGTRMLTPKFNVEACTDMNGERCFVVRFKGQIVTTIPSQRDEQVARDKAAHYWMVARNPDKYPHIYCPF